ncbi:MAG: pilus assembly protein PilC [Candidatus Saccharibacteria bacterium]|nr:pilus assembly protein PilC [Candidatus Saccharibacteria bacterium]
MLTYTYTARNPTTGKQVRANVQADSEGAAVRLIRGEGLVPTDIKLSESSGFNIPLLGGFKNRVPAKDRVLFSRQLATLINAGLPLMQALRNVNGQTTNKPLKVILNQLLSDIEAGSTLSTSMAKYPKVFNQIYISLIAAGETSGTLDGALERLAMQQEKDADLNSKIKGAMMYPIIVLVIMVGVVGFMVVTVLPQVGTLYKGIPNAKLPFITTALLSLSDFVIHFWWVVILAFIGGAVAIGRWAKTDSGRFVMDKLKMKMPPVGSLFMKLYMARFSRTGTTLIASGVPLLQMLEITSKAVNNVHLEASIVHAIEKVKGGKSLAEAVGNDSNFLPLVPSMLQIGEQSGSMEQMLEKAAEYYEKEVDNQIATISSIIEPVMMVLLGVVAFVIVAAVLLPIYGLAGNSNFSV